MKHNKTCTCCLCKQPVKRSAVEVLKQWAEQAEKEGWDLGDLTSENYKEYLYEKE